MWKKILFTLVVLGLFQGCASNLSGSSYSRDEARKIQTVEYATVEGVRPVIIEGTKTQIGTASGAIIGGVAGSTVGEGAGSDIMTAVGGVVGGLAGAAAEEGLTRRQGIEITLRKEKDGQIISVVQQADPKETFQLGDRVRILRVGGQVRVAH